MALQVRLDLPERDVQNAVQALHRLGENVQRAARTTAASVGAEIVKEEVHQRVPVFTGLLQSSMQSGVAVEPDTVRIYIGPRDDMERPGYGDPAVYGEDIEKHGSPRGRGKAFMKRSAKAAFPKVVGAVRAILAAAATGNVFVGKE